MPDFKSKKSARPKKQDVRPSNDQLGENAGEGRLMKEQERKEKRK